MKISLTQLQGFNAAYKLLDYCYKKTTSDDIACLAGDMLFWGDGSTADPAIWSDWLDAIENKQLLSKQEAFDGMIKFLDIYRSLGESGDITLLIDKLCSVKDCDDISVPLVEQWNHYLMEALSEPEGTKEYLSFGDPMQNITQLQGFNTGYKLLDDYYKKKKSVDTVCLADNMLFLTDGDTVDSAAWADWSKAMNNQRTMTKQEAFDSTIRFLESYGGRFSSADAKLITSELRSAKNCDDMSIPFVQQWNFFLVEAINEPGGTMQYLKAK